MEDSLNFIKICHKICRICLEESDNLSPLFPNNQDNSRYPGLAEKIREFSDIKLWEDKKHLSVCSLPTMICDTCIENTKISYKFRLQCQHSAKRLQLYHEELIQNNLDMSRTQSDSLSQSQDLSNSTDIQSSSGFDEKDDLSVQDDMKDDMSVQDDSEDQLQLYNRDDIFQQLLDSLSQPNI